MPILTNEERLAAILDLQRRAASDPEAEKRLDRVMALLKMARERRVAMTIERS